MNILRIGITHFDQEGLELINSTFEEILLDEICTRTTYTSVGEEAIDEALNDWDEGNTDAIMIVPAKDDARLNPASLEGMDMIIWGNLRMAFVNEEGQTQFRQSNRSKDFIRDEENQESSYIQRGKLLHHLFDLIHHQED